MSDLMERMSRNRAKPPNDDDEKIAHLSDIKSLFGDDDVIQIAEDYIAVWRERYQLSMPSAESLLLPR